MVVRNTERWIPGGFTLENALKLGLATISEDENYILVSYLDTNIRLDEDRKQLICKYVLFVNTEKEKDAPTPPQQYNWQIHFSDDDENTTDYIIEVTTDIGVLSLNLNNEDSEQKIVKINDINYSFTASSSGLSKIIIKVCPNQPTIPFLEITHHIVVTFRYQAFEEDQIPIALFGHPRTSSIVANDFRHLILAAMGKENNGLSTAGISSNLLLSIFYINSMHGLLEKPIFDLGTDGWENYLNDNILTEDLYRTPVGVSKIKPHLLAMFLEGVNGTTGTLMDVQVWDNQIPDSNDTYLKAVFDAFKDTDDETIENQVAIYNLLRFPKSSVTVALTYLEKLKGRHILWASKMLTKADHSKNAECVKTIVSEYTEGPTPIAHSYPPTSFADQVYNIMYSFYISAFTRNEIFFTKNAIYRRMMTNEFHEYGQTVFHPTEPENYLKRLTQPQKDLLFLDTIENNRLTAFIIFGDGYAERLMGARFTDAIKRESDNMIIEIDHNVRPNASFALFNRINESASEMVFYTRFLSIGYQSSKELFPNFLEKGYEGAREAKLAARALLDENLKEANDYDTHNTEVKAFIDALSDMTRENMLYAFFTELSKMALFRRFTEITSETPTETPTKYLLSITSKFGKIKYESSGDDTEGVVPYIAVKNGSGGGTPDFMVLPFGDPPTSKNTNTIHGTLNTKGCWMMLRNHLWNWPCENKNDFDRYHEYEKFSIIHVADVMTAGDLDDLQEPDTAAFRQIKSELGEVPRVDIELPLLKKWWRNLNYFEFVNRFLEYQYKKEDKYFYSFPPNPAIDRNGIAVGNNIFKKQNPEIIDNHKYKKGKHNDWADLYLFKRTDRFTNDENDTESFDWRLRILGNL